MRTRLTVITVCGFEQILAASAHSSAGEAWYLDSATWLHVMAERALIDVVPLRSVHCWSHVRLHAIL